MKNVIFQFCYKTIIELLCMLAIPNRSKELVIPSMRAYTRRLRRPVYLFKTVVLYLLGV